MIMSPKSFISRASHVLGSDYEEILGPNKFYRIVRIRVAISYVLRVVFRMSFGDIANCMNRDHTTIISHMRKYDSNEKNIKPLVDMIKCIPNEENYEKHL